MSDHEIVFLRRAVAQVEQARTWWIDHRPEAPALFDHELNDVVAQIAVHPFASTAIRTGREVVRRALLARTRYLLYFRIRPRARRCEVISFVHASRIA